MSRWYDYMLGISFFYFFFFQAEDGIRDRSVSRGLGDVYKRQDYWGIYSWESEWVIKQIEAAELNPNICGVVFVIDGPGGMVSHLDMAAARR